MPTAHWWMANAVFSGTFRTISSGFPRLPCAVRTERRAAGAVSARSIAVIPPVWVLSAADGDFVTFWGTFDFVDHSPEAFALRNGFADRTKGRILQPVELIVAEISMRPRSAAPGRSR